MTKTNTIGRAPDPHSRASAMPEQAWTTLSSATVLPAEWDELARPHYILGRDFLQELERAHPCGQAYHLFYDGDSLDSILISYKTRMNMALYTPFDWYVDLTMLYAAVPVTCPGMVIGERTRAQVERFIRSLRGYSMIPNWRDEDSLAGLAMAPMSPSIYMPLPWTRFDDYLKSMRRDYRKRCNRALRRGQALRFEFLSENSQFDERLYDYYRHVYDKSQVKLEQLPITYFQSNIGKLLICKHEGQALGFIQLIPNGKELVGALIGYDPELNGRLDLYHNLQLRGIRYAIESGYESVEMGQTAEETKLKYGGRYLPLNVMVNHSNPLWRAAIRLIMPFTAYKPISTQYRVFNTPSHENH